MKCLIIASGPSLTIDDVEFAKGKFDFTIVVNDNYKIAPWADVLYACDDKWWTYHDGAKTFTGQKITPFAHTAQKFDLMHIHAHHGDFDISGNRIAFGCNSGYQALNLAVLLGFSDIYLLGYEFQNTDKAHWFGDHPKSIHVDFPFLKAIDEMSAAAPILKGAGISVTNLSRNSALSCFTKSKLEDIE